MKRTREPGTPGPKYPSWYAATLRLYKGPFEVKTQGELDAAMRDFSEIDAGERSFYPAHMMFLGLQALWMIVRLLMECRDGLEEIAELLDDGALPRGHKPEDDDVPEADEAGPPQGTPAPTSAVQGELVDDHERQDDGDADGDDDDVIDVEATEVTP